MQNFVWEYFFYTFGASFQNLIIYVFQTKKNICFYDDCRGCGDVLQFL